MLSLNLNCQESDGIADKGLNTRASDYDHRRCAVKLERGVAPEQGKRRARDYSGASSARRASRRRGGISWEPITLALAFGNKIVLTAD